MTESYAWFFLISLPIISALIGWLTNRVAIRMLFRPRRARKFAGLTWQGLIPRRQADIAVRTGEIIEKEILKGHLLREHIEHIHVDDILEETVMRMVYHGIGPRLKKLPLLGGFVNDSHLKMLHQMALEEIKREAPHIVKKIATQAESRLDIRRLVEDRIREFDTERLERVVNSVAEKEFRSIEQLGAVLGFVIGLVQVALLLLSGNYTL